MNHITDILVRTALISLAFWVIGLLDADLNFSWEHLAGAALSALALELYENRKHRVVTTTHHNNHL